MAPGYRTVGIAAARACGDKKGAAISLIHTGDENPISDYLLLVTALSNVHLETLEHEVKTSLKAFGLRCLHHSRPVSDRWRVLDYGGLVVHLMTEEAREFYSLEKLYPDSPRVKWAKNGSRKPTAWKRTARKHAIRRHPLKKRTHARSR